MQFSSNNSFKDIKKFLIRVSEVKKMKNVLATVRDADISCEECRCSQGCCDRCVVTAIARMLMFPVKIVDA